VADNKTIADLIEQPGSVVERAVNEDTPDGAPDQYTRNRRVDSLEKARAAKAKKARSRGVGESRIHASPPDDPSRAGMPDWSKLTLNGQPIPEHLWGSVPYRMTDQGAAEFNAGRERPRVEVVTDERDKKIIGQYREDLTNAVPLRGQAQRAGYIPDADDPMQEGNDPFALLLKQHVPKGMHGMMMSTTRVKSEGMRRGRLMYEPLLDEQGRRIGLEGSASDMFIAIVPQEAYEREQKRLASNAQTAAVRAQDKVREHNDHNLTERARNRVERRNSDDFEGLVDDTESAVEGLPLDRREFIPGADGREFVG
jgi:hypothetical protein